MKREISEAELPALERPCEACEGKGYNGYSHRCEYCEGTGYQPTKFGQQVLDLMHRRLQRMIYDTTER